METLTLRERYLMERNKLFGFDLGVMDHGLYYLTAIVLKDHVEGDYVVINGTKRKFLQTIENYVTTDTYFKFLLKKIIERSTGVRGWKKWVREFLREYRRHCDFIIGSEMKFTNDILSNYDELITIIQGVDREEEFTTLEELYETFQIEEMIDAVLSVDTSLEE